MIRLNVTETGSTRRRISQPKVSDLIADILRERILSGEFDELLPSQDSLLAEFSISKPSLREALRMLESEGLITVRRGNLGGSFVHRPEPRHAAYMLALVLQSRSVPIADVAAALKQLEGVCAGLCAAREDRASEVIPQLARCNLDAAEHIGDTLKYVTDTARFHELLVSLSGSETMKLVVGALETVWLSHVREWAESNTREGTFPDLDYRRRGLSVHEELTALIAAGEVDRVSRLAEDHFDPSRFYSGDVDVSRTVQASDVRAPLHDSRNPGRRA